MDPKVSTCKSSSRFTFLVRLTKSRAITTPKIIAARISPIGRRSVLKKEKLSPFSKTVEKPEAIPKRITQMGSSMATTAKRVSVNTPLALNSLITIIVAAGAVAAAIDPNRSDTARFCLKIKIMARKTNRKPPSASKIAIRKMPLPKRLILWRVN